MRARRAVQVKPDGVHRGLVGDIIKRFEQRGYKLVGIKVGAGVPAHMPGSKHEPYAPAAASRGLQWGTCLVRRLCLGCWQESGAILLMRHEVVHG